MAFVWVPQWVALPIVFEEQMGDLPPGSAPQPLDITTAGLTQGDDKSYATPPPTGLRPSTSNTPFHAQLSAIPQSQLRLDPRTNQPVNPHYPISPTQDFSNSTMNMGSMASALPDYSGDASQSNPSSQRPISGASTSALVYQLQQINQLPGQHGPGGAPSSYNPGFGQNQFQQNYGPPGPQLGAYGAYHPNQQRPSAQPSFQNFQQPSPYMYYPPYGHQGQYPPGFPPQATQAQAMYGRRTSLPSIQGPMAGQNLELQLHDSNYAPNPMIPGSNPSELGTLGAFLSGLPQGVNRQGPSTGMPSIPRGPPRKPKQSGHALWVGNLPPGTTVIDLKDHFSRDATKDIESLFLISKSNCAFVNYRTEASCTAAMHRFHDSRFHGVRLVCRLRRSSAPASGIPTGPSAMVGNQPPGQSPPQSPKAAEETQELVDGIQLTTDGDTHSPGAKDKYFIVKSLTLQDLELSVRNGIWATQSHNEVALNNAYKSTENVYLIFSANKSGEYFGYARMTSPILEDSSSIIRAPPEPENLNSPDIPKSIPTPASEFAPKGRIIDDSARGTIFWEAELSDEDGDDGEEKEEPQVEAEPSTVAQSWGKPFKIEWMSTNRLPFYRTRGLRNPWNANREVKIARDGTELETSVGERLVQMFHRLGPSNAPSTVVPPHQHQVSGPLAGPHMRPGPF